jgi:hypothetical protein
MRAKFDASARTCGSSTPPGHRGPEERMHLRLPAGSHRGA